LRYGLDFPSSEYGPMTGSCEHGNEPSGSVNYGDWPSVCLPLTKCQDPVLTDTSTILILKVRTAALLECMTLVPSFVKVCGLVEYN
jgi:hypothetical protein